MLTERREYIDFYGDIWELEKKSISRIQYWSASTKNKKKENIREFTYDKLVRKLNKLYGRKKIYEFSYWNPHA